MNLPSCAHRSSFLVWFYTISSIELDYACPFVLVWFDTVDWEEEYVEAKDLCVRVLAGCGREELARFLADKHSFFEGTIRLCHEAEMQQVRKRDDL